MTFVGFGGGSSWADEVEETYGASKNDKSTYEANNR